MSIDQIDEYEQSERVRTWLKNNGSSLITGIALGLAAIGGWNWWQAKGESHRVEAATQYVALVDAITADDAEKVAAYDAALRKTYADTPYAALSALRHAEYLASDNQPDEALALLRSLDSGKSNPAIANLIGLRIARLLVSQGKAEDAIKQLDSLGTSRFPAVANEIRGDAERARGHRDAARKAYGEALTSLDQAAPTRPILQLKFTDAGGRLPDQPEI